MYEFVCVRRGGGHNSIHNTKRERKMQVAGGEAEGGREGGEERLRGGGAGTESLCGEAWRGWRGHELSLPGCFWRVGVGWCRCFL